MPKACSLGLSATSQQYFSLRTNQPPATSRNQPAVLFFQNKPAPAISHQPTEQAANCQCMVWQKVGFFNEEIHVNRHACMVKKTTQHDSGAVCSAVPLEVDEKE
jgi:hypothetical protein